MSLRCVVPDIQKHTHTHTHNTHTYKYDDNMNYTILHKINLKQ